MNGKNHKTEEQIRKKWATQSLKPEKFKEVVDKCKLIAHAMGREM